MSTSIHDGRVTFADSLYGTDDDPVDTVIVRDGIANGLLHAADSMAQVRCNFVLPDFSTFGGGTSTTPEFCTIAASPVVDQWYRIGGSPFGTWPLTLHADGAPYPLRIRVGAAASSNTAATITIRVVIAPDDRALAEVDREDDNVYETSFAAATVSTTPTWSGGFSQGTANSATLLQVSAAQARAWTQDVPISDAVSGGSSGAIQQSIVSAHVFCKTSVTTVLPRLHALYLAEYVGT